MLYQNPTRSADQSTLPGTRFRDGPLLPEMVVVPPGKFWMGAYDQDDRSAGVSEQLRHWVEIIHPLAVGQFPVTFAEWDAFADADSFAHRPSDHGSGRGPLPVLNVSWEDAESYVSWLSANTGRPYRLLSEAEWEYGSRAGAASVLSTARPPSVGSSPPNTFGLHGMHANLCELVADSWHDNYQGAPADGSAWEETSANIWRVVRSASSQPLPRTFRDRVHHTQRRDNMTFRVACALD